MGTSQLHKCKGMRKESRRRLARRRKQPKPGKPLAQLFSGDNQNMCTLFIIARTWKQPRCPSADEWIRKPWYIYTMEYSDQIRSVAQSCPTLCDPMNRSTPGLPVHHQLPEFTQTHVLRVSDAIQPSHPLLSPSPPAPNPSQHQSLFQ